VDVQPLHALAAHGDTAVADEGHVPLFLDDRLRLGQGERMRRGGADRQPFPFRRRCGCAPEHRQRLVDLGHRCAHVGIRLEDGGEQLGLHAAGQVHAFHALEDPVDRRDLLERHGVEDHQLLFDPERQRARLAEVLFDHAMPVA
jgi:hypothetical protein